MKSRPFAYARPDDLGASLDLLRRYAGDCAVLAGGQSLMPALNLRLSAPSLLVDINRISSLRSLEQHDMALTIGATVRYAELERSQAVREHAPLISMALPYVAHPAIRNRGTLCGSLAHADPAAEMPACALALGATMVLESAARGRREVSAQTYFCGLFETARAEDELLVAVRLPRRTPEERFGFGELSRRRGDFAMVGVACRASVSDGKLSGLRVVVFGTGPVPHLSQRAATLAEGEALGTALARAVGEAVAAEIDPEDTADASGPIRRKQAAVLVRRTLEQMAGEVA